STGEEYSIPYVSVGGLRDGRYGLPDGRACAPRPEADPGIDVVGKRIVSAASNSRSARRSGYQVEHRRQASFLRAHVARSRSMIAIDFLARRSLRDALAA